jgi:DNA-binding response OmpR family regulator
VAAIILIVEDEVMVRIDLEAIVSRLGFDVVEAMSKDSAKQAAETKRPDAVLLDVRLADGDCFPFAAYLRSNNIPFAFVTGLTPYGILEEFSDVPIVSKPFMQEQVRCALVQLLSP